MGRVAAVVLLVVLLGLLFLQLRAGPDDPGAEDPTSPVTGITGEAPSRTPSGIVVTLSPCERTGDTLEALGWVRNGLRETVRYVEITVTWIDSEGGEVETDFIEVVGGETMAAGDSAAFRVSATDPRAVRCEAEVFAYDPFY
jgi:hypothetical protein